MEYFVEFGFVGLFVAAFLAATVLPLSSEIVLLGLLASGGSPRELIIVATLGNVLGAVVNYGLGYWAGQGVVLYRVLGWLHLSEEDFQCAKKRYERYGVWALCLAWVPIIGDPITLLAGVLRVNWMIFLAVVTLVKGGRYMVLAYGALQAI